MTWNQRVDVNRAIFVEESSSVISSALMFLNIMPLLNWFSGTSGVLLRKVNGTAIVQLPSKRQVQVMSSTLRLVEKLQIYIYILTGAILLHSHRYWRLALWRWDACPTSITINGSLAKLAATAGSASAPRAACGSGREAGRDARLNHCHRWRVLSTCPRLQPNNGLNVWRRGVGV